MPATKGLYWGLFIKITFLLDTLCYYLKGSKPMNFTGISIYLISAEIPGCFSQQSRTFCIISKILNGKREFQQLFVRQSRAGRAGAGRGGQELPVGGRVAPLARCWVRSRVSPECQHPFSHWLLSLSYYTPVWLVCKKKKRNPTQPHVYIFWTATSSNVNTHYSMPIGEMGVEFYESRGIL